MKRTRSIKSIANPLSVVGLFSGIGGLEEGFRRAGHEISLHCEIDPAATAVLEEKFAGVPIQADISKMRSIPAGTDVLTAGFPCQDLSQAGRTTGLAGARSGLIHEVFRLLQRRRVPWLVFENVPFTLRLAKGAAIDAIIGELERLGYRWAYRLIDTRAFGLPQRRERLFILASRHEDPSRLLLADDFEPVVPASGGRNVPHGFYWTEGNRGLGWAVDSVPTLKGGSSLGIPSPPAIWTTDGMIVTPDIRDAELLQGFDVDWTEAAATVKRQGYRWTLVGNAVTVDVAEWIAGLLSRNANGVPWLPSQLTPGSPWPKAAFGAKGERWAAPVGSWPVRCGLVGLGQFLKHEPRALSFKASAGFLSRLVASRLRHPPEFLADLERHVEKARRAS